MAEPQGELHDDPASAEPGPPCRQLRSKGMYVYTDGSGGEEHDGYDNTIFWCQKTFKDFGPDDGFVNRDECCNTSRPCYDPL
jgi:hypothetical protein